MLKQYYILIQTPCVSRVLAWLQDNDIPHEIHANRIRFRPHTEQLLVQYHLQWADSCAPVELPYPSLF